MRMAMIAAATLTCLVDFLDARLAAAERLSERLLLDMLTAAEVRDTTAQMLMPGRCKLRSTRTSVQSAACNAVEGASFGHVK